MPESVAELRARFEAQAPSAAELRRLDADPRAGVRALARQLRSRAERAVLEESRFALKLRYEREHWSRGLQYVGGCDEVGVGPLAGPVVAGACILRADDPIRGIDDSKVLDEAERDSLTVEIKRRAIAWAIGLATIEEIDTINIRNAGILAMRRALEGLNPAPQHVLMDARIVDAFPVPQTSIIKGDALSLTIGAASILAKTHRDALMVQLDAQYPGYGFAVHKGYGVPAHLEALQRLGACAIHRRSFAPVQEALGLIPTQRKLL